ncbi:MAG: DNA/RNA nuclease SfsA, partial [Nitrospira sp.]|nr:DNA/RNA nuclease SfsA [Nitrospira sp.]
LRPGAEVYICASTSPSRKTSYTLLLVRAPESPYPLISLDTLSANRLAEGILRRPQLSPFGTPWQVQREIKIRESRLDFYLYQNTQELFVEVKSVSLVKDQVALFPDAPTLRGVRHLRELINLKQQGKQTAVLFVAQRDDLVSIRPNEGTDPLFATTLREAYRQGVQLFGFKFQISREGYTYRDSVPVEV